LAKRLLLPLFPLISVLFPGGVLPLRIFEPRYMEVVSVCMKEQSGFGVSLILSGKEVGEAATTYEVGTLVNIIDWDQRVDRLAGIHAEQASHYEDAVWVSGRLAELLPIGLPQKQYLLQMDDPLERLTRLCDMWDCMQGEE